MKPDFALSLSFDGIGLLLRGSEGWLRVGAVSLHVEDLTAELADLRRAALGLRPGGFVTKLVIPDAQIRYLTLETGEVDARTRQRMIRHALDGATPYSVEDLVYDWSADGSTTHVAAVARETLDEAEAFALEHRFNPVCFVAVPQQRGFATEVFFGETAAAAEFLPEGSRVERDARAMEVTGDAPPPAMNAAPDGGEADDDPPASSGPEPETLPGFRSRRATHGPSSEASETGAQVVKTPRISAQAAPTFVSRRGAPRRLALPPVALVKPDPKRPAAQEVVAGASQADATEARSGKQAAGAAQPVPGETGAKAGSRSPADGASDLAGDAPAAPSADGERMPGKVDPAEPASTAAAAPRAPAARSRVRGAPAPEAAAGRDLILRRIASLRPGAADDDAVDPEPPVTRDGTARAAPTASAVTQRPDGRRPGNPSLTRLAAPRTAPAVTLPAERGAAAAPDEAARLTRFGERGRTANAAEGRGRGLALGLSAAVVLGLLAFGAYSAVTSFDAIERLFGERETETATVAALPDAEVAPTPDALADSDAPADSDAVADAPQSSPAPERAVSEEAARDRPEPQEIAARATPEPLPDPEDRAPTARALAPDEAAARYAATGIWQVAPDSPAPSPFQGLEDLYVASIDGRVPQPDAVALSRPRTATDRPPEAPVTPPPPGSVFDLDQRGLVVATPEGALTPQGVRVFAARPPAVPPSRAEVEDRRAARAEAEAAAEAEVRRAALAGFRPLLRPAGLAEADERTRLDGQTRDALAAFRPFPRPDEIAARAPEPEAAAEDDTVEAATNAAVLAATTPAGAAARAALTEEADPGTVQTVPADAGTAQAVRASLAPAPRPGGFERVVEMAPEMPAQPVRAVPQAQSVSPSIPSSASVARAATETNAINLRRLNLIGVYGDPSNRRALVRLSNGRYQKVEVGDRIDGGRISAIGEDQLRYTRNGRNLVLRMPQG